MKKLTFLFVLLFILMSAGAFPQAARAAVPTTYFALGAGWADVIPHQIVRAGNDRLYMVTNGQGSAIVRMYRTTAAGLPDSAAAFAAPVQVTEPSNPIGVDAVYDGGGIIHVIMNLQNGAVQDHPFDLATNTFKPAILLASNGGTVGSGLYVGTSGAAGMVDTSGRLHVVYWTNTNHILHRAYTYNGAANSLTPLTSFVQVDSSGGANHPSLAVSPADNSLTVAWVSQADNPVKVRTRTRTSSGTWGAVQSASTSPAWTSADNGINIDQGPSLIIDAGGIKHMTYIQAFDPTSGDYGRVHYLRDTGSGWTDQSLSVFAHDPALAITSGGEIYIIGHGHPKSPSCKSMDDMCVTKRSTNGTWGNPVLFAARPGSTSSFDTSPSVKWSAVGFNRPDVVEFMFSGTPYDNPTIYYARLQGSGVPAGPTISGNTGTARAVLRYTDGTAKTAIADSGGYYSFTVSTGWSGTVTPSKPGYWFTPVNRSYTNVQSSQVLQNYISTNLWAGGVTIQSNRNVVAIGRPHIGAEVTAYNGFPSGSLTAHLPMLFKNSFDGSYDSAFYVQNLDTAQAASITIDFRDSEGLLSCSLNDTIEPLASKGYWVPAQGCLPEGWVGGAVVTSNRPIAAIGRPHIGTQVMTYNGFASGSLSAYLPMLFRNAFGGGYDSAIYVQNLDDAQPAAVSVQFYDTGGTLTCALPAEPLAPLAVRGYWLPDVGCLPDGWVGSAVAASDLPIAALARPHIGTEIITYNGSSSGSLTSFIPMLFKNAYGGSYAAAFYVQNVDPDQTAHLTIKFIDSAGTQTCSLTSETAAPLSSNAYWVPDVACLPAGWVGGAVVTSDKPIVTVGRPHIDGQVTAYGGFSGGSTTAHLPMLFKNMWGNYNSAFYIQNTDASGPAAVTVSFYDQDGGLSCRRTDSIPALASLGYWLPQVTCMP